MLEELKREAYEANLQLPKQGLINLTFGNASALEPRPGHLCHQASGVAYETLRPTHGARRSRRKVVEGKLKAFRRTRRRTGGCSSPSRRSAASCTRTRRAPRRLAQAGRAIPAFGTTHADYF